MSTAAAAAAGSEKPYKFLPAPCSVCLLLHVCFPPSCFIHASQQHYGRASSLPPRPARRPPPPPLLPGPRRRGGGAAASWPPRRRVSPAGLSRRLSHSLGGSAGSGSGFRRPDPELGRGCRRSPRGTTWRVTSGGGGGGGALGRGREGPGMLFSSKECNPRLAAAAGCSRRGESCHAAAAAPPRPERSLVQHPGDPPTRGRPSTGH